MATLNDVAKVAKVSVSTVSRVISGSNLISEATAEIVRQAMEEVNYHPNAVAKSLANKMRTKIIGLVLPRDTYSVYHNQFFMDALSGITLCAQEKGYYIMNAYQGEENSHTTIRDMIKSGWIDGAILTTVEYEDQNIKYLEKKEIPYAIIGSPIEGANAISVDNDNVKIMDDVCQMLIDKGIRRIALICGDTKYIYNKHRHDGYINALKRNGIAIDRGIMHVGMHGYKNGYDSMGKLLDKNIEGVVTTDDILAFGAVRCMNDNNVSYPITGFNNTMITEIIKPHLTSVDIRAEKLGYEACNMLINYLENDQPEADKSQQIDAKIVHRESTDF
ncbi:MAG: LacI family DNA-binding transcriptional regulator [Clostridia bacterium]|nr:LacI family DNA-binding transcriptional regulator [Clostridia bacterium]